MTDTIVKIIRIEISFIVVGFIGCHLFFVAASMATVSKFEKHFKSVDLN